MSENAQFTGILGFMVLLSAITAGVYVPALPEMEPIFQSSEHYIKFSITIYFVGAMLGAIGVRTFVKRYGHEKALRIFIFLFIVGSLICALSFSIGTFLFGRFVQGIGVIAGPVISLSLTADRYERELYRHTIAWMLVLLGVGTGISHLIGIAMMRVLPWQYIFYLLCFLGIIGFILSYFTPHTSATSSKKRKKSTYRQQYLEHSGLFLYYQGMIGVLEGALYAFLVISPYILRVRYGWTLYEFSVLGITLACSAVIGAYINAKLRPLVGVRGMVLTGVFVLLCVFVFLFFLNQASSPIWLIVNIALLTIGSGFILENLVSQVLKYFPLLTKLSSSLIMFSKIGSCALVIGIILFLPASEQTMSYFILFAVVVCAYGYFKMRGKLFPPKNHHFNKILKEEKK